MGFLKINRKYFVLPFGVSDIRSESRGTWRGFCCLRRDILFWGCTSHDESEKYGDFGNSLLSGRKVSTLFMLAERQGCRRSVVLCTNGRLITEEALVAGQARMTGVLLLVCFQPPSTTMRDAVCRSLADCALIGSEL